VSDVVPFEPRPIGPPGATPPNRPSVPEGYPEVRNEGLSFRDYIAVFRRQIWIILGSLAVFGGAAAYLVFTAPPAYRAEAVVRLIDTRRQMTGEGASNPWEGVLGRETDLLLSQIQVMTSRQVASNVVDREGLQLLPLSEQPYVPEITNVSVGENAVGDTIFFDFRAEGVEAKSRGQSVVAAYGQPLTIGGVTLTVASRPRPPTTSYGVISEAGAIAWIRQNFKATPRPKTDVIDIHYTSSSPQLSQRVANAVALTFQEFNAQSAQQASRRRRIFLDEQLRQTDAMLQAAMADYSAYRAGQQVFSSREKASAQQAGIVDVDIRRADLAAQKRTYESLLAQSQRSGSSDAGLRALVSSPGIAANPVIQQLYATLTKYEATRDSLVSDGAAPTNPDLLAVNTLVSTTTGRLMAAVRNQIQSLDAQIAALDDLKRRSTAEIVAAPRAETEEARLAQQVQTVQRMADQLQEEHQRAKMAEAVEAGQVEIVDLAVAPDRPLAAGRIRRLALGIVLGLLIGLGGAILRDGMNTSIRRRDDVEKILQVPGLAVIPRFAGTSPPGRITKALPALAKNGNGRNGGGRADGLVTVYDAGSSQAEAYRTLRTNLIFSQAVHTLRSLVVTSAAPGEGKTTTASNLAVSFAQQGMRVLIVDCDLRRSRLHKMFGVPREPGITECVLGINDIEKAPLETSVTGLYVLPSGQLPPNPSELLGGERMRKTLASLSEAFDLIVLDTPPLLAASDAAILSTIADGVVLVVRAGVTEAEAGQQAMQQLMSVGARVVGAVLNDPDAKVQSYGGYYKYDYATK
jgi:succinoglycan biosynthesis transport protein ExoP